MNILLYELKGLDGLRYSQFAWRSRMALAHKGVEVEARPVRVSDKKAIAFSHQAKVPILVAGDVVVPDSWKIAEYLERTFPAAPSLFGGEVGHATSRFFNAWVDRQIIPLVVPLLMVDVIKRVDEEDAAHLRAQIETAFRFPLETLAQTRERDIVAFRRLLDPVRQTLRSNPFISGSMPAYPDYILFSVFQWARIVSAFELLESADAIAAWCERMLDLFGGLARAEKTFAHTSGGARG